MHGIIPDEEEDKLRIWRMIMLNFHQMLNYVMMKIWMMLECMHNRSRIISE